MSTSEIERRTLLRWGMATAVVGAGAAALSRPGHAMGAPSARRATVDAVPDVATSAEDSTATARLATAATTTTPVPRWAQRWPYAIRSIDDYSARCSRPVFPRNAIMLTVDDGPSPVWTPRYLRLFAKYDVVATFCMIGEQVPANRAIVKSVAEHGHTIANHTWNHDEALNTRSTSRIYAQIRDTNEAIGTASGFPVRQFRAPGGNWGSAIFDALARFHMMPLGWDIDPRDWALPGTHAIESAMLAARRHNIVLCHDGGGDRSETYAALEYVLPRWKDAGYRFVTLPSPAHLR